MRIALWGFFWVGFLGPVASAGEPADEPLSLALNGADVNLRYGTATGLYYTIDKTTDLDQVAWSEIFLSMAGTNAVQNCADFGAGTLPKCFYRLRSSVSASMSQIPAGSFQMGDSLDGVANAPVHSVYVSTFYMDKNLVTKAQWDEVANWAEQNGYDINAASALGKAANHPAQLVTWYECVKWANARSQKEGLTPCYTVEGAVYKTGEYTPENNLSVDCNFSANGYRLPTEAEWEKAARGGLSGKRFPWGDTITHSQANYYSSAIYSYDVSPTRGNHPTYHDGTQPYTSPVGSFARNGYGLYDMAGNVWQWCTDLEGGYGSGARIDPINSPTGQNRVRRGGDLFLFANTCRVSYRSNFFPTSSSTGGGFRCVRR